MGRPLLFGLGYFAATLFPVLGFVDQGFYDYSLVADHWQYYSIIGVIALVVAAGAVVCRRIGGRGRQTDGPAGASPSPERLDGATGPYHHQIRQTYGALSRPDRRGRIVGVVASAGVLVVLGVATWARAGVYATSETLWRDTVTKNPNAWMSQYNLGLALGKAGKLDEAIAHFGRAVQIKPGFAEAHNYLGTALLQAGRVQEAIEQYRQALRIKPDYVEAQMNLDRALADQSSSSR